MPKYVIEREIPGCGAWPPEQLKAVAQTSCGVLSEMGPQIQWQESYVTGDTIYCVYIAPDEGRCTSTPRRAVSPPTGSPR